ncbi:molybdopterin molybdotransferase MoeA [Curtobacterium sp. MCBD17_035]|uniref:molybdopterin molybdotransferase MoeA n=1 Tax=Curtobacterium sp. MCBD17_035 TaxID=2175673 RepID=UPI000DA78539|nr:gephyrin-like molybdotransferase Glp [Curtobacterium sp. MCBD17_035]WIB66872.1 molybdopterin molybdotransferase MoeA [Curtobacterium sp. MCBD17_035]
MRTIEDHRLAIADLVVPVLAALAVAPGGREDRLVDDLAAEPLAGHAARVLAVGVTAPIDLPPFDNSQMDGFALRAADAGVPLRVVAPIAAGASPPPLAPGTAAPIMTGAAVPAGADVVVPVEAVPPGRFPAALDLPTVTIAEPPAVGTFVRRRGSDLPVGGVLATAGAACTPALLGLLAAAGVERVTLVRRPRVLVVSTGSEVAPPDGAGGAGADRGGVAGATIGDANGAALRAALAEVGAETRAVRVPDDVDRFRGAVTAAVADWADLVVTTGGISMGAFEVVREALEPAGLTVTGVAMQPGGPQAFGSVPFGDRAVPVVAFPGNPVSALVSFEVFLRPVFARHAGLPDRPAESFPAGEAATSPSGKHQIRRGRVEDGTIRFVGGPSSHLLAHLAEATHLVHVPVGTDTVSPGDVLTTWRIR